MTANPEIPEDPIIMLVSQETLRKMPDHIEPGSILAEIRCPLSFIWTIAKGFGADNKSWIYKAFYKHLNKKHFG